MTLRFLRVSLQLETELQKQMNHVEGTRSLHLLLPVPSCFRAVGPPGVITQLLPL